jgi:hypothetical protein
MVKLIGAYFLIFVAMVGLFLACRGMDAASCALRDWFRKRQQDKAGPPRPSTSERKR